MVRTNAVKDKQAVRTEPNQDDSQFIAAPKGVLLQAKELTIRTRAGVTLLSDISFHIEPGELVALTGVSYTGKSLLLQSLAGLRPPASGEILIDGVDLYANLKAFGSSIGFVPSEFPLPQNLTVAEVMQEGAKLHLPRRMSDRDHKQRIQTLLATMDLTKAVNSRVGSLSRIEKRKLNLAIELIGFPGLLLLDAPAEQPTPFEEVQITILLKELSRQGITIIQVDQRARSAGLSDQIVFLAPGGLLAWFGPPDEAFIYLRSLVPKGIAKDLFGLREALEVLTNPQVQEGVEWAKRFKANPAYQKHVDDPQNDRYPDLMLQTHPLLRLRLKNSSQEKVPPRIIPRANALQKFILLIRRNARLLLRDKTVLSLLALPPLVALLDFIFAAATRSQPDRAPWIFGSLAFLVLLTSALLVQNEISKERSVYQYENRTRTLLFPYVLSKVWLVGVLAAYQGVVWTVIHAVATGLAAGVQVLLLYAITVFLVSFIGGIVGLLVSALSRKPTSAANWLLLLTIPQLIFSGATVPLNVLSWINPLRYALDALLRISGYGEGLVSALLGDWLVLGLMSLCLIAILMGIQGRTGNTST